jgi:hypothetical protein
LSNLILQDNFYGIVWTISSIQFLSSTIISFQLLYYNYQHDNEKNLEHNNHNCIILLRHILYIQKFCIWFSNGPHWNFSCFLELVIFSFLICYLVAYVRAIFLITSNNLQQAYNYLSYYTCSSDINFCQKSEIFHLLFWRSQKLPQGSVLMGIY